MDGEQDRNFLARLKDTVGWHIMAGHADSFVCVITSNMETCQFSDKRFSLSISFVKTYGSEDTTPIRALPR
jgi:hypothetical protein